MPKSTAKAVKSERKLYSSQVEAFLEETGDDYYDRNEADFGKRDTIIPVLESTNLIPSSVLEVGCANGWLLKRLKDKWGCEVRGVEPSAKAVAAGNKMLGGDFIKRGVAQDLRMFKDDAFDLVIYGWCLWLCDPRTMFKIVAEGDRVLRDGGLLIVLDGIPPRPFWYEYAPPGSTDSESKMIGWMMDHSQFWLAHPAYSKLGEATAWKTICHPEYMMIEGLTLMRKSMIMGIPSLKLMRHA